MHKTRQIGFLNITLQNPTQNVKVIGPAKWSGHRDCYDSCSVLKIVNFACSTSAFGATLLKNWGEN